MQLMQLLTKRNLLRWVFGVRIPEASPEVVRAARKLDDEANAIRALVNQAERAIVRQHSKPTSGVTRGADNSRHS